MITGCLPSPLGLHLESSSGVDRVPFLSAQLDIKWVVARRGDGRHRDSLVLLIVGADPAIPEGPWPPDVSLVYGQGCDSRAGSQA
jgi:hypothetical protein